MKLKFDEETKKSLIEFFIVLSSFSFIFFYLYWRITKKQYYILLIQEEVKRHFGVFLYFFIASIFILILLLVSIYIKKRTKQQTKYFGKFLLNIKKIFNFVHIFYKLYTAVFHSIKPTHMQHIVTYTNNILDYSNFKNNLIVILVVVLPRVLIALIFIYEIYIKSLHLYFFSLLLLLIPLFFRFLLFVYSDIDKQVLPKLNELVERVPNAENISLNLNGETQTFGAFTYKFRPEFAFNEVGGSADIDHFMLNLYNPMLFIGPHMEVYIMPLYNKYTTITVLIYMTIQVMGWGYILFLL